MMIISSVSTLGFIAGLCLKPLLCQICAAAALFLCIMPEARQMSVLKFPALFDWLSPFVTGWCQRKSPPAHPIKTQVTSIYFNMGKTSC